MCVTLYYVGNRNITFSLPAELVKKAKMYAAARDLTINALVRGLLQEAVSRDDRARMAADRLLTLADRGPYFSTDPGSIPREALHDRR